MVEITNHGEKRLRKRLGISKRDAASNFAKAIQYGRKPDEFKGSFRKYLDYQCMTYKTQALVYENAIYFMDYGRLITVLTVPGRFSKYLRTEE